MTEKERFIVVTGKDDFTVQDTYKGIQITDMMELVKEANLLHESRMYLKQVRAEKERDIELLATAINGLLAVNRLRQKAYIYDEDWE